MHLDRLITLRVVQPWRHWRTAAVRRVPILMYHRIATTPEPGVPSFRRLCTSPIRFCWHMKWLADAGWRGVPVSDVLRSPARPAGERLCAITFDDGFRELFSFVAPVLKTFGFRASFFLPTGFIGHARRTFQAQECLTWSEVRRLHEDGFEIGSHTVTHRRLHTLPWETACRELTVSKATIESEIDARVGGFSFPFAFPEAATGFGSSIAHALSRLGYDYAVTTVIGRADPAAHRFRLNRLPVSDDDDRELLLAKLDGGYDWLRIPQSLSKRVRGERVAAADLATA